MSPLTQYVAGFLFTPDKTRVVLLRKHRADPEARLFNGVGGKMGPDELPKSAMSRVFKEETGVSIPAKDWMALARLEGYTVQVYFFVAVSELAHQIQVKGEDEVGIFAITDLCSGPVVPSVRWLVPLAFDNRVRFPVIFDGMA
ncbi:MAG: NUDIX domain-containing protein [Meiothermus sp.]|uniref:NUDIX domain-containing protein n=1 Tax=Meiothermus sp. TaxID=1955249 RepID=UPI0025E04CF8|nr:NUDIX domain-containing protein [Meiothermus sp.]MCS7069624.1 NUDIX domain-containing protein [Meiothermus sp.]MCX7600967.1 NUDIX domain-containing protein [Meiothermus sp.]MDW8426634.1 NUDIX domain-containing protein [Meiothermus sp.]